MKLLKKNHGFTVVELLLMVSLLSAVGIGTGSYMADAFKESNQLASKTVIQSSVTALMNELETVIKQSDPNEMFKVVKSNEEEKEYIINQQTANGIESVYFKWDGSLQKVDEVVDNKIKNSYEYIEDINLNKKSYLNGIDVEIVGQGEKYKLNSEIYTRNTIAMSNKIENDCPHENLEYLETNNPYHCLQQCIDCGDRFQDKEHSLLYTIDEVNNQYHYKTCIDCKCRIGEGEEHTYKDGVCMLCDFVCKHNYKDIITSEYHYKVCSICGYKTDKHTDIVVTFSPTAHYLSCRDCNHTLAEDEHTIIDTITKDYHYKVCRICGYEVEKHTNIEVTFSPTARYLSCRDCNHTLAEEEHTIIDTITKDYHYKVCRICGYEVEKHTNIVCTSSPKAHYLSCRDCKYTLAEEEHTIIDTITKDYYYKVCRICGYEVEKHTNIVVTSSPKAHYLSCRDCNHRLSENEHTYVNGVCTVCGAKK